MDWDAIKLGLKASVLSTACCTTPLLLGVIALFTGLLSLSTAVSIARFKNYLISVAVVFYLLSLHHRIKSESKGVCDMNAIQRYRLFIVTSFITFLLTTLVVIYLLLPIISGVIFS